MVRICFLWSLKWRKKKSWSNFILISSMHLNAERHDVTFSISCTLFFISWVSRIKGTVTLATVLELGKLLQSGRHLEHANYCKNIKH